MSNLVFMQASLSRRIYQSTFLWAIVAIVLMDAALFRSGFYERLIKPNSSAGVFRYRRKYGLLKAKQSTTLVAAVGDSRIGEGFSARMFDQIATPTRYTAVNLAVPGSTLRVWYYLLEQIDPHRNAFKLIVIPMSSYSDGDESEDFVNRLLDLQFLLPFASPSECLDVLTTYTDQSIRLRVIAGSIFRAYALHSDIKDFLLNPPQRFAELAIGKFYNDYKYEGRTESVSQSLTNRNSFHDCAVARQQRKNSPYKCFWLNRIVAAYKGKDTKILVIKIPTDPLLKVPKDVGDQNENATLACLAGNKNVFASPEYLFGALNRPDYFFDDVHMNGKGRKVFSEKLSKLIMTYLGIRFSPSCRTAGTLDDSRGKLQATMRTSAL